MEIKTVNIIGTIALSLVLIVLPVTVIIQRPRGMDSWTLGRVDFEM
ncbi:MAG: hypothetical protein FWC89_03365 [Defluviitaleaceae bacterium]|nr:hypothetical protein [Defluviitaleaceae bacterium]